MSPTNRPLLESETTNLPLLLDLSKAGLSESAKRILDMFETNVKIDLTLDWVRKQVGQSAESIRLSFVELTSSGFLMKTGRGKATRYRLASRNLPDQKSPDANRPFPIIASDLDTSELAEAWTRPNRADGSETIPDPPSAGQN